MKPQISFFPRSDGFPPDQRRGTWRCLHTKITYVWSPNKPMIRMWPPSQQWQPWRFSLESWSPKTVKCHNLWPISPQWMSMFHLNSYRCTPWPSVVPPVALTFVRSVPMCGGRRKTSWSGKIELELTFVKPKIIKCILIKNISWQIYIYFVYHLDFSLFEHASVGSASSEV